MEYSQPNYPLNPPPRPSGGSKFWMLAAVFLAGLLMNRVWSSWSTLRDPRAESKPVVARGNLAEDEQSTIALFRTHSPAVVFITTTSFGFDFRRADETALSQGTGSGFIWDAKDGYVVTNDHVISDANVAQVTLFDQSVWKARLVGRAPGKDLAVLKIDAPADRLQSISVGSSDDLLVGQKVFAIGNPFGLDHTLTTGVISALDREITAKERSRDVQASRKITGVIQTDAAINPGNSGGPLLDSEGRLIGVNTAIYSPSGAYAGIGFAIPVDTVNRIVPELIRHGRIIRPETGIVPFRDRMTRQLDLEGVLVRDVYQGTPADLKGIRPTQTIQYLAGFRKHVRIRYGDLIVAGNGAPIKNLDDWFSFLEKQQVGNEITLTLIRDLATPEERREDVQLELIAPLD